MLVENPKYWCKYDWVKNAESWGFKYVTDFVDLQPFDEVLSSSSIASINKTRISFKKSGIAYLWEGSTDYFNENFIPKKIIGWNDLDLKVRSELLEYHILIHKENKDEGDFFELECRLNRFDNGEQDLIPFDYLEKIIDSINKER